MLPKKEASRAQQYLMSCPGRGWQPCCFSYIITKILWFSCILTKGTGDFHLLHLLPSTVYKGLLGGGAPLRTPGKAKKIENTTWKITKKPNFPTPINDTSRGWEIPVQSWGFVLSWVKYSHLIGKDELECCRKWKILHVLVPRKPQVWIPNQATGNEETAAIPRRKRDQTSLKKTTIEAEPFPCLLCEKPNSIRDKLGRQIPFPSPRFLKGENTPQEADWRGNSQKIRIIPRKSGLFPRFPQGGMLPAGFIIFHLGMGLENWKWIQAGKKKKKSDL